MKGDEANALPSGAITPKHNNNNKNTLIIFLIIIIP